MPLLLDTCAALWIVAGAELHPVAEDAMDRARDLAEPVFVSAITAWEVGLLAVRGRFASPYSPKIWFDKLMAIQFFEPADVSPSIFIDSCFLPGKPPRDPSDRIIVATAREHGYTIVTRDRLILEYRDAGQVLAIQC
ncbi:MAG: type II toxin-antitoxin system VapC family toxin [Bauldia sp.]